MRGNILVEFLTEKNWLANNQMSYKNHEYKGVEVFFDNSSAVEVWIDNKFVDQLNCRSVEDLVKLLKRNTLL